ncbi:hypothetical protein OCL06_12355 [Alteromonas sp. ASW11-19]|uniref:Uncharacterized protein n=1 Tax=Alteromonas salexigens TaxID=2982530 RepID=A0ABT2VPY8_9ALTE|nr:hypothetical protein [Alteromonas salexigens]MCU7555379.1 hypothetical protein [Alteromonas salexigens]
MIEISENEVDCVSGAGWGHVAVAIAIAEAAFDFYEGYSDNRR